MMSRESKKKHFSLQWNDFHSNLSTGFHSLLKTEDFVDVTLAAENKYVQAHRLVLSVCSPYFKDLFRVNPCKHPTVILKGVGFQELLDILEFMYRGQVNVHQDSLAEFLKTAEMLQVKGLCEDDNSVQSEPAESDSPPTTVSSKALMVHVKKQPQCSDSTPEQLNEASSPPLKRRRSTPQPQLLAAPPPVQENPIVVSKPNEDDTSEEVEFVDVVKPKIEVVEDDESNMEDVALDHTTKSNFSDIFEEHGEFLMQDASDSQYEPDFPCSSQSDFGAQGNDQGNAVFVPSSRGNQNLIYYGYRYRRDYVNADKVFWKCINCKKNRCRARLFTMGSTVFVKRAEHNHEC